MNRFWFKRYKYGCYPSTLQGWLVFAFIIGSVFVFSSYVEDFVSISVAGSIAVLIGFQIMLLKTPPRA